MQNPHGIKRVLFNCYAPVSAAILTVAFLLLLIQYLEWNQFAAIAAGIFGFAFGVQKQNLGELKIFKELFEQFNKRYDEMDFDLNHIHQQPPDLPLTEDEKICLFKYFNLCGEEFLYFKKGFIFQEVWVAWNNGMKYFRKNPRIKILWDEDLGNESYYGLTF